MQSKKLARGLIFALCLLSPFTLIPTFRALGMIQIHDQGAPTTSCNGYGYGYGYSSCTTTTSKTSTTHTTVHTTTSTTTTCHKCNRLV
ncbi:MAG TPA: hypothetical protein VEG61_05020 [Candidatus Dormibacteraeota bacterium]|nr:hypothetical protein [Candidatus Dormibacteraeota bacterium]